METSQLYNLQFDRIDTWPFIDSGISLVASLCNQQLINRPISLNAL